MTTPPLPPDATPDTVGASGGHVSPRPAPPPAEELLFGRFEALSELARGGMGIVYKVRQVDLGRVVALKVLKEGEEASAEQIERFHREAELAAKLRHPNIVPIHEVGVWKGRHFFTMEYIDGETLEARLRKGTMPVEQAAALLEKVARAVHFAHTKGIVHRDLKPGNILLDAQGEPQVTDFGLARSMEGQSTLTRPGAAIGTPFYMAPEQIGGRLDLIDARTDVFALGVIAYEMLSGKRPFSGDSAVAIFQSITQEEPPPLRYAAPATPRDLATVCERALEKARERRYATALALAEDVARFLRGEPVLAKPVGTMTRIARRARRHATVTVACVLGAIGLAGAVYLRHHYTRQMEQERSAGEGTLRATRYEKLIAEGAWFVDKEKWAQAKTSFDEAIALDGSRGLAYRDRAMVHWKEKRLTEAIEDYTRAIARDPKDAEAFYFRSCVKRETGARKEAEEDVSAAIAIDPRVPKYRNARGALRADRGDDEGAIEDFTVAMEADATNAEFCDNRGLCQLRLGRTEQAMRDFTLALDRNPRDTLALLHRAELRGEAGQLKEAIEDLARYVNLHPDDPEGFFQRGTYREQAGQHAEAVLDLDEALRIDPKRWKALLNRGLAQEALGHAELALADYERAIAIAPKEPQPWLKRSILRIDAGDGAGALADCDAALALDGGLSEAHWNRALALEMLGRKEEARKEWEGYLAKWPEDPSAAEIRKKIEELK